MASITQDMRYRLSLIQYPERYGITVNKLEKLEQEAFYVMFIPHLTVWKLI